MLKIGVIGYGSRINNVVRQLVETGEVQLVAVTGQTVLKSIKLLPMEDIMVAIRG